MFLLYKDCKMCIWRSLKAKFNCTTYLLSNCSDEKRKAGMGVAQIIYTVTLTFILLMWRIG